MIYNKGTVSFDQWLEKLKEAIVDDLINSDTPIEGFKPQDKLENNGIEKDLQKLQSLYWEGADIYEAINEMNQ